MTRTLVLSEHDLDEYGRPCSGGHVPLARRVQSADLITHMSRWERELAPVMAERCV